MNSLSLSWDYECWLQWERICIFRTYLWPKVLLHTSQQYGSSLVSARWSTCRPPVSLNVLLHTSERYGCSLLCTQLCIFRCESCLNVLLHTHHSGMGIPQYVYVVVPSDDLSYWMFYYTHHSHMDASQYEHVDVPSDIAVVWMYFYTRQRYGRVPVCTLWCKYRLLTTLSVLLHTSQPYGRSQVCTRWYIFRLVMFSVGPWQNHEAGILVDIYLNN